MKTKTQLKAKAQTKAHARAWMQEPQFGREGRAIRRQLIKARSLGDKLGDLSGDDTSPMVGGTIGCDPLGQLQSHC